MIAAIALDDEPPALKVIEKFCEQIDGVQLQKTFTRPSEALKYINKFPVDLIFLDIQMPSLSGIDFCKMVPQQTMVVFVTAFSEFAVEGFNLSALDYLLKPYTLDRFRQTMDKALEYQQYLAQKNAIDCTHIYIRADYQLVKVRLSDVLYVEGCDDYVKIYLQDQKTLVARMTMKSIQERLPARDFIRVHRSFILSVSRIESLRNKMICICDREIPIGSSYEEAVLAYIKGK